MIVMEEILKEKEGMQAKMWVQKRLTKKGMYAFILVRQLSM